jgi:hypothetical protein
MSSTERQDDTSQQTGTVSVAKQLLNVLRSLGQLLLPGFFSSKPQHENNKDLEPTSVEKFRFLPSIFRATARDLYDYHILQDHQYRGLPSDFIDNHHFRRLTLQRLTRRRPIISSSPSDDKSPQ